MIYKDDDAVKLHLALKGNIPVPRVFKDLNCFYSCVHSLSSGCSSSGTCSGTSNPKTRAFLERVSRLNRRW